MTSPPAPAPARVVSAIQPSAELHIGNYFGAIATCVALQDRYPCIYGVVDLHAMTMPYTPAHLRANTDRMLVDLLACGIDPQRAILFVQSQVPEHTELAWIISCLCSYDELRRMNQFKEKAEQLEELGGLQYASAGLFNYPVLQAADILVYRARYVPIGKDQLQHLELSRSIARRFNQQFGAFFPELEPVLTETPTLMSLAAPDRKMSKSLGPRYYIGLFEDEAGVRQKVMAAVTDPGVLPPGIKMSPGVANLFAILQACGETATAGALLARYEAGDRHYGALKAAVADALVALTTRLRARRAAILDDAPAVQRQVAQMSEQARAIAADTMREVRALVGLPAHRS